MAEHYFRVSKSPTKPQGFFHSWVSSWDLTSWFILANVLVFFMLIILRGFFSVDELLALQPNSLFQNGYYWTLLTSMFMHANFAHLFVNMFSLFFVGRFLEAIIGKKRFFWLYMISGIFAGLFFAVLSYFFGSAGVGVNIFGTPDSYAVGASGALFGIVGVLAFLIPKNKVSLLAGPLIAIIIQAVIGNFTSSAGLLDLIDFAVTIYIFISIFSMMSFGGASKITVPVEMPFWLLPFVALIPLIVVGLFISLPIGNMAHLGGLIAGAVYGIYLRLKYKRKTQMISEYFSR